MKRFLRSLTAVVVTLSILSSTASAQIADDQAVSDISGNYASCGFPQTTEVLFSYAAEDAVWPEIGQDPMSLIDVIPAGTYKVSADSFDHHSTKHDKTQPDERWQFWAYGTDMSTPIYYSGYTDDLADTDDRNTTQLTDYVTFTEDVTALRYVHYAFAKGLEIDNFNGARIDDLTDEQKAQVMWNSVLPDCINFTAVSPVECVLTTTVSGRNVVANVELDNQSELPITLTIDAGDGTKSTEGNSFEHTYTNNGTYTLAASVYLNGAKITECSKTVTVSPSGTIVLGASTTTPTEPQTTQVLGASTTLAATGVNSTMYVLVGLALLLVSTPLLATSVVAARRK